jgi:hypothetical protein
VTNSTLTEQNQFSSFLQERLVDQIFESGSDLRKELVAHFKVSDGYARKIIERAVKARWIRSSKPYTFGRGQYIYMPFGQELDFFKVKTVCYSTRPALYRLMQAIENNEGIISFYEGLKVTASPDENSSTKVTILKDMVKLLMRMDLVYERQDSNGVNYILLKNHFDSNPEITDAKLMGAQFNKMVLDSSLMADIIRWLVKSNLIDNNNAIYRNKKTPSIGAKQNNLYWDAYSYTRATGINPFLGAKSSTIEKQTLVVLDVVLSTEYSQLDLDGFLARIQINLNSVKTGVRKILPIVVYRSCSTLILGKISKLGFLAFDIGSIFGTKIYSLLNKLKEVNDLLFSGGQLEHSVKDVLKVIRNAGQEDALRDLRGVMFEILMFPVLSSIYANASATRGKTYSITDADGKKEGYEYDYIFNSSHPQEIVVVELKGYNESVSINVGDRDKKGTLKWFFERTLPFARQHFAKEIAEGKRFRGVYITSAHFWKDCDEFIERMNKSHFKPAKMDVAYSRKELLAMLAINGFTKECEIIEEYYAKAEQLDEA